MSIVPVVDKLQNLRELPRQMHLMVNNIRYLKLKKKKEND